MATATYVPIATQTVSGSVTSITFSSIPSGYTDLRLVCNYTCTSNGGYNTVIRFNGDSASNYSQIYLLGNGSGATGGSTTSSQGINLEQGASTLITSYLQTVTLDIFSYANTSVYKTSLWSLAQDRNGSGNVSSNVSLYRSTSAITSFSFGITGQYFSTGTTATLWGI